MNLKNVIFFPAIFLASAAVCYTTSQVRASQRRKSAKQLDYLEAGLKAVRGSTPRDQDGICEWRANIEQPLSSRPEELQRGVRVIYPLYHREGGVLLRIDCSNGTHVRFSYTVKDPYRRRSKANVREVTEAADGTECLEDIRTRIPRPEWKMLQAILDGARSSVESLEQPAVA